MNSNSESRLAVRHTGMMRIIQIAQICILLLIINHTMSVASTTVDKSVKSVPSSKSVIQTTNGQGVYKNGISKLQQQLDQLKDYVNNKKDTREKVLKADEIVVYPNPATTDINIKYNFDKNEEADFIIYDILGIEYLRTKLYGNVSLAQVSTIKLLHGIYLYKISKQDKTNFTGKLIIE